MCSVKKVFLEISQNSQENTCAIVYFLIKLQASDLTYYRTTLVAASAQSTDDPHVLFYEPIGERIRRNVKMISTLLYLASRLQ